MDVRLVVLMSIGVLLISYCVYRKSYELMNNVVYISKEATARFLVEDMDGYIASMSIPDLYARNVKNHTEYRKNVGNATLEFTEDQKLVLDVASERADVFLNSLKSEYIDTVLMTKIGWKLALTIDGTYEGGYPHTRSDIIFLSPSIVTSSNIVQTLVHEKIHIYQRQHIARIQHQLQSNGYTVLNVRTNILNIRANPDVDKYVYQHPNGTVMLSVYTSSTPKNIMDTRQSDDRMEHPFEELAYILAEERV